jgi:hypothetical protein
VGAEDSLSSMELKQPEGIDASFRLRNDVVYEVTVGISFKDELRQALIEKYGAPSIKVGGHQDSHMQEQFWGIF